MRASDPSVKFREKNYTGTGQAPVRDYAIPGPGYQGFANVTFTSNSFTAEVPLAVLGGDDGLVDVATASVNLRRVTDCAPNGGAISNNPTIATAIDHATVNSYPVYLPVVTKN